MLGFGLADVIVIIIYLAGITVLGIWVMRRIEGVDDFIMPRRFGNWMMIMHSFGTATHSDQAVSVASKSFTNGLSGIWYQWLYLFATPFYWLIAPMMRRFRALTVADIFELRYTTGVAGLYAVVSIGMMVATIGLMLKGSGAVIDGASGGTVSSDFAIVFMTILFVAYGTAGGLGAAIITDFIQGILTIAFSFLLLPFVLDAVGGLEGMRATIADPEMFSLVAPGEIGVFYIAVITLNGIVGIVTQPHNLAPAAAGKTEREGQVGFVVGSFTKRICTVAWSITGLAGVAYFAGRDVHPDLLYGMMASEFLPALFPGLLGLFIATLLASVMSSCDSFMIAGSALFTENIYKKFRPGRDSRHYLLVARVVSVAVVVLGVLYAYWLEDVIQGLEIFWKIASMMGIAFWLGLFWRRTSPAAAWTSTLGALLTWWITTQSFFVDWVATLSISQSLGLIVEAETGAIAFSLPWQMIFYLTVGLILGIVTSLVTRGTDPEKLERYYKLLRTPVLTQEGNLPEPCTIPDEAVTLPRRPLIPFGGIEILMPSKRSVIGFLAGWVVVAAIIGSVYSIAVGQTRQIPVQLFDPGYLEGDSNYHSLTAASDGMIYFSVNTHHSHSSVRLYRFDPDNESVELVGDINEVLGEDVDEQIPHGKIHTPLVDYDGYLYFGTHTSQYDGSLPDMSPDDGRAPYHGGHFIRYELETGEFEELAHLGLPNEGIITMAVDTTNGILYGLTWPTGLLLSYELDEGLLHNWGAVQERGEWGRLPEEWEFINRKLAIDPPGNLYGSTDTGRIWHFESDRPRPVDYLEPIDLDHIPTTQEEAFEVEPVPHYFWRNWRTILWNPDTESFWGLHGGSTQLFEFKPEARLLRTVRALRADGVAGGKRNPYRTQLGFMLGPDNTLYYLAHGPAESVEGRRDVGSSVHLLTYAIDTGELVDHGSLIGPDGRRVFFTESIEFGPEGDLYTVAWVETIDLEQMERIQRARGQAVPEETKDVIYEIQLVRIPPVAQGSQ